MKILRPLSLTIAALAAASMATACSNSRSTPGGSGGGGGARAKDTGISAQPDSGMQQNVPDSGMILGCGSNPNMCVAHELIGPSPACACLNACEQGWMWDTGARACVPAGQVGNDAGTPPRPDTGPYDGGVPTTDPFSPANLAATYANAICGFQTRCEPAFYGFLGNTEADCIADQTRDITASWTAFGQVIGANRLGFSQTAFDRCMAAFGNADCERGLDPGVCSGIFSGSQAVGQPCALSAECRSDAFCTANPLGACGSCQARALPGADCSQALCTTGNDCLDVGQGMFLCIPFVADENQTCGTIQDGLCRGRLQCVGDMNGATCRRPGGQGAACDPMQNTNAGCNIFQNQLCVNNSCAAVSWVGAGQSCAEPSLCNSTGRCDMGTMQCIAWPGAGSPCFMGDCADGTFCDNGTNNCTALKGQGSQCMLSSECVDPLFCVNGSCGALSHTVCQ